MIVHPTTGDLYLLTTSTSFVACMLAQSCLLQATFCACQDHPTPFTVRSPSLCSALGFLSRPAECAMTHKRTQSGQCAGQHPSSSFADCKSLSVKTTEILSTAGDNFAGRFGALACFDFPTGERAIAAWFQTDGVVYWSLEGKLLSMLEGAVSYFAECDGKLYGYTNDLGVHHITGPYEIEPRHLRMIVKEEQLTSQVVSAASNPVGLPNRTLLLTAVDPDTERSLCLIDANTSRLLLFTPQILGSANDAYGLPPRSRSC